MNEHDDDPAHEHDDEYGAIEMNDPPDWFNEAVSNRIEPCTVLIATLGWTMTRLTDDGVEDRHRGHDIAVSFRYPDPDAVPGDEDAHLYQLYSMDPALAAHLALGILTRLTKPQVAHITLVAMNILDREQAAQEAQVPHGGQVPPSAEGVQFLTEQSRRAGGRGHGDAT